MRLAIISDLHLGDPTSLLVSKDPYQSKYKIGLKYQSLIDSIPQKVNYLVLLGDIFDFSISSYEESYNAARIFFHQIAKDNVCEEIIYVPGNHDFAAWHILMHEINVINRIKNFYPVEENRWSCPAILRDVENQDDWLTLPFVAPRSKNRPKYGGIFLENLTQENATAPKIPFNVAYPNLYFITKTGESILLTHGHYIENYWSKVGNLARKLIAPQDISFQYNHANTMDELIGMNLPSSELASSSIGQAGPLTPFIRSIQKDLLNKSSQKTEYYLKRIKNFLDEELTFELDNPFTKRALEFATDKLFDRLTKLALEYINNYKSTRFNDSFLNKKANQERLKSYWESCLLEIQTINAQNKLNIPFPQDMIFGHTHEPIAWNSDKKLTFTFNDKNVNLYNTGGWLQKADWKPTQNIGAEIFLYDTEKGFSSTLV